MNPIVFLNGARRSFNTLLRRLVSPVFLSTSADGRVLPGLAGIPDARPLLFVGNHQTYALDTGMMVEQLIRERGIMPRGLAHPIIFRVRVGCRRTDGQITSAPHHHFGLTSIISDGRADGWVDR
jgi:1-acyl-sn-glycerol-3-phosphate acyltransferase